MDATFSSQRAPANRPDDSNGRTGAAALRGNSSEVAPGHARRNGEPAPPPLDLWLLAETLVRRWFWLLLGGAVCGLLGLAAGLLFWKSSYTASAQLIRYSSPDAEQVFGPRQAAEQTLPSILHSPDLLQNVAAKSGTRLTPEALAANLRVMPEHNSDIIVVAVSSRDPLTAVKLVNRYAREAVRFTQNMQSGAANEVVRFTAQQLAQVKSEIAAVNGGTSVLAGASRSSPAEIAAPPSALAEKLQTARAELAGLLAQYTEAHPLVQQKQAEIAALEKGLTAGKSSAGSAGGATEVGEARDVVVAKLQSLENARLTLLGRQQAAQALAAHPPGYCQLLAPASASDVVKHGRKVKVVFLSAFLGLVGVAGAAAIVLLVELMDDRLKSAADVQRVTRLPVLAAAGDLSRMSAEQKARYAFRAWTGLQGRLSPSPNHGLVCGFTSARHGEGRSTWVNLLATAANQQGFRVLTVATRPVPGKVEANGNQNGFMPDGKAPAPDAVANTSQAGYAKAECPHCGQHVEYPADTTESSLPCPECAGAVPVSSGARVPVPTAPGDAMQKNFLATPDEVAEKLMGPEPQPIVHIPLPGWVWNLERRKQWQGALRNWSRIENVVILVELPPATEPEAVLLAENLPNVVWLTASGQAAAAETREQLETLRHARCQLAGAVLNCAPKSRLQARFSRWLDCAVILVALPLTMLHAVGNAGLEPAPGTNQVAETHQSLSVASPVERAAWQRHLTLGPGDILNLALFGEPKLAELNVPVGPDGCVSFLEAQSVPAAGLTVDQLRQKLDAELAQYRRAPQVMVTPVAYDSKKYYLLGSVVHAGAYPLNRPVTIIEAIARAGGLETALQGQNVVELADLQRAFLIRDGRRLPVDFERLFQHGDLSQNVPLAPGDYVYLPAADLRQVYVVGEVQRPGPAACTDHSSVLGVIADQGGFTKRAWKNRVLVVRGSLEHPQTFVINVAAVLAGREPDFRLKPNDIVYVHYRPWAKAEELLDQAATAFIQSAVITWSDLHAGPLITTPIIQ